MPWWATVLIILAALFFIAVYICFTLTFRTSRRRSAESDEIRLPYGDFLEPWRKQIEGYVHELRAMPYEEWRIKSDDGLTLVGRYYEFDPSAPVEILLHGYRGSAEIDLSGGMQRCFAVKHNALLVDLRGCGKSGGSVITFGLKECRDTLNWLDEINRRLAPKEIYIGGVSMGATTALLAGGSELPDNVKGIVADCGFHSAREIIRTVIGKIGLPVAVFYPLVRLGGLIFGGFDIDTVSAEEAVKRCRVPVLFFHGEHDGFVPCHMSEILFTSCASPRKKLITVKEAAHGVSYLVDPDGYVQAIDEFFK